MNVFLKYFLLFFIYSVLGWTIEVLAVLIEQKKFINRGFLIGPYCPIYGVGAVIIIMYLDQYKNNILTVFLLASIICTILEYLTSVILEKIFHARWWDYSQGNKKFQLNGRVCLSNCIAFGLLSLVILYLTNPLINKLINKIPTNIIIGITIFYLIIFITDLIISCNILNKLKSSIATNIRADNTIEINEKVKNFLKENHKIFQVRVLHAFPTLNFQDLKELAKQKISKIK